MVKYEMHSLYHSRLHQFPSFFLFFLKRISHVNSIYCVVSSCYSLGLCAVSLEGLSGLSFAGCVLPGLPDVHREYNVCDLASVYLL